MNETLLKQIGVWLIAGAFATLVGLASAILPWWLVVPVFLLPMLVAAGWRWPLMAFVFVLLAALGRGAGIPTRLVTGLIYVDEWHNVRRIFGRHMWTQFYIDGRWIDLDAAQNQTEIKPTHIALTNGLPL